MWGKNFSIILITILSFCNECVAMQLALQSIDQSFKKCIDSFVFIGNIPILKDTFTSDETDIWHALSEKNDDEIDGYLSDFDIDDAEIKRIELSSDVNGDKLETAFFGNKKLSEEFFKIKKCLLEVGDMLSVMQMNKLNWLVQNFRGDREAAKMLVSFYSFKNEKRMFLFWKCVALYYHFPVTSYQCL